MQTTAGNDRDPLGMARVLRAVQGMLGRREPLKLIFAAVRGETGLYLDAPESVAEPLSKQIYGEYPHVELVSVGEGEFALPPDMVIVSRSLRLVPDIFPLPQFTQQRDSERHFSDPLPGILESLGGKGGDLWSVAELALRKPCRLGLWWRRLTLLALSRPCMRQGPMRTRRFAAAINGAWPRRLAALAIAVAVCVRERGVTAQELQVVSRTDQSGDDDLTIANDKLGSFLFEAEIRLSVAAQPGGRQRAEAKLEELTAAVKASANPRLAAFHAGRVRRAAGWLPKLPRTSSLLSEGELAALFHPPLASMAAAGVIHGESRQPEPPRGLPNRASDSVLLGHALFRGESRPAHLSAVDARRHQHVVGRTGMGKSVYLHNQLRQRIHGAAGVMLLEPHGDLFEATLRSVPRRRWDDTVVFDPTAATPLAYNPLDCRDPTQRERLAAGLMAAFEELFGLEYGAAPRLLHILRNAVLTAMEVEGTTLMTIVDMLRDGSVRRDLVAQVSDDFVRNFWRYEFDAWTERYRQEAVPAILNKLGQLLTYERLRKVLCQPKTQLDVRQIADRGQILLCNLSVGHLGGDMSRLLGKFLLASTHAAIMTRAEIPEAERRDFYLTVDELAEFDCPALAEMLEQVRKYRCNLCLSHQHLGQLSDRTQRSVLANAGTFTAFSLGFEDAQTMAAQLGEISAADIVGLRKFHAYLALMIDGRTSSPMLLKTLPPSSSQLSDRSREALLSMQPTGQLTAAAWAAN